MTLAGPEEDSRMLPNRLRMALPALLFLGVIGTTGILHGIQQPEQIDRFSTLNLLL